jgi:hypothetical protein
MEISLPSDCFDETELLGQWLRHTREFLRPTLRVVVVGLGRGYRAARILDALRGTKSNIFHIFHHAWQESKRTDVDGPLQNFSRCMDPVQFHSLLAPRICGRCAECFYHFPLNATDLSFPELLKNEEVGRRGSCNAGGGLLSPHTELEMHVYDGNRETAKFFRHAIKD